MKIAVISRSDTSGGAAVVSRRLTEALREAGAQASLLVIDGVPGNREPYVVKASYPLLKPLAFMAERGQIFLNNGMSSRNLWKVDTAKFGLPLYNHPVVKEADAVILNWVNQGMLSLKGIGKIAALGKKVLWTMHDMWPFTGICHHAITCRRYAGECGECPYLLRKPNDLSSKIWGEKLKLYSLADIKFVAVSNWLAERAKISSLLGEAEIPVIPNPFRSLPMAERKGDPSGERRRILFAAATLDNWIKGLDTFREAANLVARRCLEKGNEVPEVWLMGGLKDKDSLLGFDLPMKYIGEVTGDERIAEIFGESDVVVNCSHFENLPGTLVEGQAYGAVPVAFDRGGQSDIITHLDTGYLTVWSDEPSERAAAIADGIEWAINRRSDEIRCRMRQAVEDRFSYKEIADRYLRLIKE